MADVVFWYKCTLVFVFHDPAVVVPNTKGDMEITQQECSLTQSFLKSYT